MKNTNKNTINTTQNRFLLVFTVVVILLISLLTINWKNASASTEKLSSDNEAETCGSCKGYNKETVYNQNIAFIRDAAIDYFTDERLPHEVNSKKKITLEEMIEKRLVYSIVDSNGKKCSLTDSYVEVTKYENEYVFKINLSCSDISDYILVHKGCYTYCANNDCVKPDEPTPEPTPTPDEQTYEYEYKKVFACVMSDWSQWSEWTTDRQEITNPNYMREETKTETKVEKTTIEKEYEIKTTFNCDQYEGYKLLGELCVKSDGKLEEIDADLNPTTYNCDKYPGYKLDSTGKNCVKSTETTDTKDADKNPTTYNCDKYPGYKLDSTGKKCVKDIETTDVKDADENPATYNCDRYPGYKLDSTGKKCIKETTTTDTKDATRVVSYNCDKYPGYKLDSTGKKCTKSIETTDTKDATRVVSYNCNKYPGYKLDSTGKKCVKVTEVTDTVAATPHYNTRTIQVGCKKEVCSTKQVLDCSTGTCVMKEEKTCTYVDSTCDKEEQYIDYYTCPSNYDHVSEKVCQRTTTTTDTKDATAVESYNCNNYPGYTLDSTGKKCTKTTTTTDTKDATAVESYNCNNYPGYTLDSTGKKCVKETTTTDTKDADKNPTTYNCNNYPGYKLDSTGKKCVKTITTTDTKDADENPATYNCDKYPGYKLDSTGKKCVKTTTTVDTKPADENEPTYNCDKHEGYTLYGDKCVKPVCEVCSKPAEKVETQVCPEGYTDNGSKCTLEIEEEKTYTYYRYSTRSCNGGRTETKWSIDKNDSYLIGLGFRRTGRSRVLVINK